jgi:hypothetical protein
MRRNMPIVETDRPGVAVLRKKRGEHPHRVQALELIRLLLKAADRAEAGRPFTVLAAMLLTGEHAVMIGGGCRGVVPTVDVWGKHGTWTMAPAHARLLAVEIARTCRVDIPTTVRSGA